MRERRQIVELYQRGNAAVLVTLVRVEGSSYRRTGARLLIAANGEYAGSISGGCLEAEVVRKAPWLTRNGAVVERYSTLFDDTAEVPYGLGCGGTVDLLMEPAGTPECLALMQALEASLRGETARIITRLPQPDAVLQRTVFAADSTCIFSSAPSSGFPAELPIFDETLEAPQRLFLFGAGEDARPMAHFAALLGWRVFVLDDRIHLARAERFVEAELVAGASTFPCNELTPLDAVILMSHSFEQDRAALTAVLPRAPIYLGLLGSRHRSALLIAEAATRLGWPLERACAAVFAPLGLDLGGDGAEAVALAAIAEVQACREGKLAASRRMNPAVVSEQLAMGGVSRYLSAQCAV